MGKYLAFFKISLKKSLAYRLRLLVWFLWEIGPALIMLFFWLAVFANQDQVGNYNFYSLVIYYLVIIFARNLVLTHPDIALQKEIYNGERKLYIDSSCNPVIKTPEESAICGKVKLIFKDDKITETETTKKIPTRKNQGCFPPDTKIKLADGSLRRADEVFVGDLVWNPIANKAMEIRQVVVGPELIPLIEFGNEQISGRVTEDHPVLTGEGLKKAKDLKVGDEFLLADGQKQTISYVSPSPVRDGQTVVNFYFETDERDKNNFMISDGIITGNLFLQQLLSKEE